MLDIKVLLTKILQNIRRLPNYYNLNGGGSNRPTSANIDSDNSGGVIQFLSTSSMTTGRPNGDGNILQFNWDNSDKWASQLFIPHSEGGRIQFRAQKNGDTWNNWHDVYYDPTEIPDNANLNSYNAPCVRYCPGNSRAATLSNCPTSSAFFLYVEKANRPDTTTTDTYQYYTQTIKDIDGKIYVRKIQNNNGTWSYGSWGKSVVFVANNLTTSSAGNYVLDAYQGKVLKDSIPTGAAASKSVANNLTTSSAGSAVLDAYQGKVLNDKLTVETQEFAAASYSKLSGSCYAHRVGKVGILFISTLTGLTASATTDLFTISAKYRPTTAVTQDCLVAGGTPSCVRITINTNGLVQAYNYSTSTGTRNIRANIAYVCAG